MCLDRDAVLDRRVSRRAQRAFARERYPQVRRGSGNAAGLVALPSERVLPKPSTQPYGGGESAGGVQLLPLVAPSADRVGGAACPDGPLW